MPDPVFTLVPEAVRAGRHIDSDGDWIVTTFEFEYEGETREGRVALSPDDFVAWLVAGLNALGYPEGDREYIAERWRREGGN